MVIVSDTILSSFHCIYSGVTQFLFASLLVMLTLIISQRWCVSILSTVEFLLFLFFILNRYFKGWYFETFKVKRVEVLVAYSCPTLCDPMGCSPLGSTVHGIVQARILEWVAVSFSRISSQPRNQT